MAKKDKAWQVFTDLRADASGLVSVHPHDRGALLCRRTADGWLAYLRPAAVESAHHVPVDALRLSAEGPWPPWHTRLGGHAVTPETFTIRDYAHVAGGPDAAALALMARLGDPFGVHMYDDRVQLASACAVVTGPSAEWRPTVPEGGIDVPVSLHPVLALGADEFEVEGQTVFVRAQGALRASARLDGEGSAQAANAGVLARVATFEGEAYDVRAVAKRIKAGENLFPAFVAAEVAHVVAALGRGEFRATSLGDHAIKISTEIAPGWTAAAVLAKVGSSA